MIALLVASVTATATLCNHSITRGQ